MIELDKFNKWKSITNNRVPLLIELYDYYIKGDETKSYEICKCPSSIRIMWLELKKYCNENNI
jgi:hypothetical protein